MIEIKKYPDGRLSINHTYSNGMGSYVNGYLTITISRVLNNRVEQTTKILKTSEEIIEYYKETYDNVDVIYVN